MKYSKKAELNLRERERSLLEKISNSHVYSQRLVTRSKIILGVSSGEKKQNISDSVGVSRKIVYKWYDRWLASSAALESSVEANQRDFKKLIFDILSDQPRPGAPGTFTAEQVCKIVALSCETPESLGLPISQWTPTDLARLVVERGIVDSISPASVGRFLKRS